MTPSVKTWVDGEDLRGEEVAGGEARGDEHEPGGAEHQPEDGADVVGSRETERRGSGGSAHAAMYASGCRAAPESAPNAIRG